MAILSHHQKSGASARKKAGGNRILVSVNVLGSVGPIRFVVSEEELVSTVIGTTLRSYAREGRFPVLGSNLDDFLLYCAHFRTDALNPWEAIGSNGSRNFVLCKKQQQRMTLMVPNMATAKAAVDQKKSPVMEKKGGSGGSWKAWLNKSLSFKISSH